MISLEQSNEIVAYRAAWASYDTIVRKTGISLPTMIKTCKLRKDDIFKARKIAQEASVKSVSEYVEKRVQMYLEILQQACDELAGRDFSKNEYKRIDIRN